MKSKVIVLAILALFGCTMMAIGQIVKNQVSNVASQARWRQAF